MTLDDTRFATVAGPVLVIAGNAPAIRVDAGELLVADGPREVVSGPVPPVAERMTTLRLSRAAPGIDRIVFIRPDGGYVTIGALRWIYDVGVSLIILDWEGEPVLAAGRPGRDQAALRRAQALLAGSRLGHEIMMQVTATKLRGQAAVVRLLGTDAGAIDRLAVEAGETTSPSRLLGFEAAAASIYWQAWQNVPLRWARRDKIPRRWQKFGLRRSERTGLSQHATTAGGALINYCYGLAVAEMSIALLAQGFDPSLGIAHSDKEGRASLAYDMIEAARPYIDAWMVALLAETRFAAGDFDGDARGGVRVTRPLTSYLAYSLPLWRRAVEPVARWLAHVIMTGRPDPLPSPLASLPAPGRQWRTVMPAACWECGRALPAGRSRRFCSASCRGSFLSAMRRGEGSTGAAEIAAAVRAGDETRRARLSRSAAERRQWAEQHVGDDRERLRQWYRERLAPAVAGLTIAAVAEALGVSRLYARQLVRDGGVPHPRHFAALARLAGVELPKMLR